jgi:hypothetical protein
LKLQGFNTKEWTDEAIWKASTGNITVTTYQALAQREQIPIFRRGTVLILDECHYLFSDSTFSAIPMRIEAILRANLENTKRAYASATMENVVSELDVIEQFDNNNTHPPDRSLSFNTRIQHMYIMEGSWTHLNFRYYVYSDIDKLSEFLNDAANNGNKSAIFVRSKERGNTLKEKLIDSQFVYSSEEECEEPTDIALTEQFSCSNLVATKVLENGVSITDNDIGIVVIEEIDPISFMQFLGRVRIKRNTPRHLTVLIPDYKRSELMILARQCYDKLRTIKRVMQDPETCMQFYERYKPYVYYSENGPEANTLAYKEFMTLKSHINSLLDEEEQSPHAHIHFILKMLNLPQDISDSQFLAYDDIAAFKSGVRAAYEKFTASPELKADRDQLAKDLIEVVSRTRYYKKKVTGSQLQLDKINDILAQADIQANIISLGEAFKVVELSS